MTRPTFPSPDPLPPPPPPTPRFVAGEHRLVGAVWPPEGPFPGSPPGPPPDPGPQAGDGRPTPGKPGPPPQPQPGPVPHPPPPLGVLYDALPRPGLSWLPALMLPSLLLLAAIDYTAWAAWWI